MAKKKTRSRLESEVSVAIESTVANDTNMKLDIIVAINTKLTLFLKFIINQLLVIFFITKSKKKAQTARKIPCNLCLNVPISFTIRFFTIRHIL